MAFAACVFILSGCARERHPIRIGIDEWPPCAVWAVAQKEGFLKGVKVEILRFSSWTDCMDSLYSGKIDFTHSTYLNAIYYAGKGEAAKMLLSLDSIEGADGLVLSNRLASPKDLVGARIAVEVDTDEHFLLYKALASFGVPSSSVKIVSATSKEAKDLLIAGSVDACFTYDPYLSDAVASGKGRMVWSTKNAPGYMVDVVLASDRFTKSRRADTALLIDAWFKALAFIHSHPDKAYPVMAASLGMKNEDFAPFFEAFNFYSAEENRAIFSSASFRSTIAELSAFLLNEKAIPAVTPIPELFDASFVGAAGK